MTVEGLLKESEYLICNLNYQTFTLPKVISATIQSSLLLTIPSDVFSAARHHTGQQHRRTCSIFVSDIAIFVLKRDVKLQLTN